MAKNDIVLLDGIVDERLAESLPSSQRDEVFEFLVLEQLLKDYDLSKDDIESGWIDGQHDGGIDGFYVLINGHLLDDDTDFVWPRSNASIDICLITCKHHATFQQAPLDSMLATIQELFDFSIDSNDLSGVYSGDVLALRSLFHLAYRRLSIGRPLIRFHVVYASRGDTAQLGESVAARARQIEATLSNLFSSCAMDFRFVGASELIELHRKSKRFALDLPFLEHLATGKDSYVLLVRLEDYWKFVSDENGHLRRYLFDSNVRDFLGTNQVNDEIAWSLADPTAPDFWWLNNGITILATNATVPGKTIQLQDIQIVNGLQTTETIYHHFEDNPAAMGDRAVLVKIVVSSDAQVRDRIIRATNNQSPVEITALHATDKIQRDIEEILERNEWYYERRKNYYRNIGKPQARFVTPLYLASAAVALVLKNPYQATRLKSKFMRVQTSYDAVFSGDLPIEIWPILASVYKRVDASLVRIAAHGGGGERFISTWRPLVSLIVVAKHLATFAYPISQLLQLQGSLPSETAIEEVWDVVSQVRSTRKDTRRPSPSLMRECCRAAAAKFGLGSLGGVGRRGIPSGILSSEVLPDEFLKMVDALLPDQPWKPGVHLEIAAKLNCQSRKVSRAVQSLVTLGKRHTQRDGVVYDSGGRVLAVDPERVAATVDELNAQGHRLVNEGE